VTEEARPRWEEEEPEQPHVWRTLGYRRVRQDGGESVLEWDASPAYAFPAASGPIIHGGLVATLLDTAMGGACWSLLEEGETFLTARSARGVPALVAAGHAARRGQGRAPHEARRVLRG
jgi:acyl-coenzyme A thioesterase PaaI-like protein